MTTPPKFGANNWSQHIRDAIDANNKSGEAIAGLLALENPSARLLATYLSHALAGLRANLAALAALRQVGGQAAAEHERVLRRLKEADRERMHLEQQLYIALQERDEWRQRALAARKRARRLERQLTEFQTESLSESGATKKEPW